MEFSEVVASRRSVREYRPDPVPRAVIERIVSAAALAPSSMNAQPWRFHVATGRAREAVCRLVAQATVHLSEYVDLLGPERIEEARRWYSSLGDAPVVIGVSMPEPGGEAEAVNTLLSIGAAIENLMLAATAEGLGTCCVTFAWWVRDDIARLFELPEDRRIVSLVVVGHPAPLTTPRPARRDDIIDWHD